MASFISAANACTTRTPVDDLFTIVDTFPDQTRIMGTDTNKPNQTELNTSISLGLAALRITETLRTPGRESSEKNSIDTQAVKNGTGQKEDRADADGPRVRHYKPDPRLGYALLQLSFRKAPGAPHGLPDKARTKPGGKRRE